MQNLFKLFSFFPQLCPLFLFPFTYMPHLSLTGLVPDFQGWYPSLGGNYEFLLNLLTDYLEDYIVIIFFWVPFRFFIVKIGCSPLDQVWLETSPSGYD